MSAVIVTMLAQVQYITVCEPGHYTNMYHHTGSLYLSPRPKSDILVGDET